MIGRCDGGVAGDDVACVTSVVGHVDALDLVIVSISDVDKLIDGVEGHSQWMLKSGCVLFAVCIAIRKKVLNVKHTIC